MAAGFGKTLLKVIAIILVIVFLLVAGFYFYYLFTRDDSTEYISSDYLMYIKVDSIKDLYDNLIDLRAAEIILANEQLAALNKTLLEYKSKDLAKNFFFRNLLEIRTDIILDRNYAPVLILDPKFKSMITRLVPLFTSLVQLENLELEKLSSGSIKMTYNQQFELYFYFQKNLIFLAMNENQMISLLKNHEEDNHIYGDKELARLKKEVRRDGIAEIYLNSEELLKIASNSFTEANLILDEIQPSQKASLSLNLSNTDLFLSAFTNFSTDNQQLKDFASYKSGKLGVLNYLPDSTNIYTSINFKSFKDFYEIFLYFQGEKYDELIEKVNKWAKIAVKMDIEELIFSWIGSELGLFNLNTNSDPVIFLNISNKKAIDNVLAKLDASLFLDTDSTWTYEDVVLKKITFPGVIQLIVDSLTKGFDTPYYLIKDDYLFLSMNPQNLVEVENKSNTKEILARLDDYKMTTKYSPDNANIFLYYDLATAVPKFLDTNNLITDLLKLYEKGVVTLNFSENKIKVDIAAYGENVNKTKLFPGFPKKVPEGLESKVISTNILGSSINEFLYITKKDKLWLCDINNHPLSGFPIDVPAKSEIIPPNQEKKSQYIQIYSNNGQVNRYDFKGKTVAPFPVETGIKKFFIPVFYKNQLVFYNKDEKKINLMASNGQVTQIDYLLKTPLLAQPGVFQDNLLIAPKDFSGKVIMIDQEGKEGDGWPREGGGISYCSPVITNFNWQKNTYIVFLTQAGILNLWDTNGVAPKGFPVKLAGVYYADPVVGNLVGNKQKEVVTLDQKGKISIVNVAGEVIMEKQLEQINKESRLILFDLNRDRIDEIFIYGGSNNIIGLDNQLEILPGFPVKGSFQPYFTNINSDAYYEMVVGSFDSNIYAYTLNK
ncbi:MAG: DUF3352 domain-containing protein [Spirochaetes bacterium]|nr:DUF3352 domain-containing protein [Spirochaetota bacterium]